MKSIDEIKEHFSENWESIRKDVEQFVKEWLEYENYTSDFGSIDYIEVVDVQNYKGFGYDFGESRKEGAVAHIAITSGMNEDSTDYNYSEITIYANCEIKSFGCIEQGIYWDAPTEYILLKKLGLIDEEN